MIRTTIPAPSAFFYPATRAGIPLSPRAHDFASVHSVCLITSPLICCRYYDTYGYRSLGGVDPSTPVPGMGHSAGSDVAAQFYQTLLDSKVFWDNTMAFEGTTRFVLPNRNGTDGMRLAHHTWHHLVRDQIIRVNTWFPKYGAENVFCAIYTFKNDLVYQDRLGTNIGKSSKERRRVFLRCPPWCLWPSGHLELRPHYRRIPQHG